MVPLVLSSSKGEMGINFLFDFAAVRGVSKEWHWVAEAMLSYEGVKLGGEMARWHHLEVGDENPIILCWFYVDPL